MKRPGLVRAAVAALALLTATAAEAATRIKDIVDVENVRDNVLVGYGLVVGLAGTGDQMRNTPFAEQALKAMLERMGVNVNGVDLKTANVAAVSVTATLPPFARRGSRIDVQISALGDASSLQGGTLIATPLIAVNGETFAVAQGPVAVSGFEARGAAARINRGSTTAGRISGGAIVEREVAFDMTSMQTLKLALRNPDFATASRVAQTINTAMGPGTATMLDPGTVQLTMRPGLPGTMVDLVTAVEQLRVSVDQPARIVIDSASGTVVIGSEVKVSQVAIAQGNLTISVAETPVVSQPAPFARQGETAVVPRTAISVDDGEGRRLALVEENVSLRDLVGGLNALGVTPRDLITILQALKAAGALQAEIEVL